MNRNYAAIVAILGALLISPGAAHAGDDGGHGSGDDVVVCVRTGDDRGRHSTDVDVRRTTVGPDDLPVVQVVATPAEDRPIGPLDISVNAQVAVLQVVLRTTDIAVLNGVNVGITQGNGPGAAAPGGGGDAPPDAGGSPPGAGAPPAPGGTGTAPDPSGINISVNAQVAVVQVVTGLNPVALLQNIAVNINQGNQVAVGT